MNFIKNKNIDYSNSIKIKNLFKNLIVNVISLLNMVHYPKLKFYNF